MKAGADAVNLGREFFKIIEKTPQNNLESKITTFTKSLKKQTILQPTKTSQSGGQSL